MPSEPSPVNRPNMHFVLPERFYSTDAEKTKINWFLFELAQEIETSIHNDKRLKRRLSRKGVDDARIGDFCVHFAKHMEKQILDKLAERIARVRIGHEEIERFLTKIGDALVDQTLIVVAKAWDSQTEMCSICPTRCISERDEYAPMFDDPSNWD